MATALCNRIVRDHRIKIACVYKKAEARLSEFGKVKIVLPVWLRKYGNAVPAAFKKALENRGAKRRVINIGIARNKDKIDFVPAAFFHIFTVYWQKRHNNLQKIFNCNNFSTKRQNIKEIKNELINFRLTQEQKKNKIILTKKL